MCIINNLSSVNERRKNLRGEEKGERERVGEVWILFRERGRKRWWREGYKGRNQKRAQHAFISSKVKTTCFSFFWWRGVVVPFTILAFYYACLCACSIISCMAQTPPPCPPSPFYWPDCFRRLCGEAKYKYSSIVFSMTKLPFLVIVGKPCTILREIYGIHVIFPILGWFSCRLFFFPCQLEWTRLVCVHTVGQIIIFN